MRYNDLIQLMRLDKPIGILLLLWPTLISMLFVNGSMPSAPIFIVLIAAVCVSRTLGCVINDLVDRNKDCMVERTKDRPIASGKISVQTAIIIICVLGIMDLFLVSKLPGINLYILSVVAFLAITIYPFMKRITYFPQLVLGICFAMPVFFMHVIFHKPLELTSLLLFFAFVLWTIAYDTVYAYVDRVDDLKAGIKSTALLFSSYTKPMVMLLEILAIVLFAFCGYLKNYNFIFFITLLGPLFHVKHQFKLMHQEGYKEAFLSNNIFGMFLFFAFFIATQLA